MQMFNENDTQKRFFVLASIIGLVGILVGSGLLSLAFTTTSQNQTALLARTASNSTLSLASISINTNIQGMTLATQQQKASPLLWGTNFSLQDDHDQVLTSDKTRKLLQQMHMRMVRIPTRNQMDDKLIQQAAQIVKNMNAAPLIILQGDQSSSSALANDLRIIKMMNNIFGKNTVYYEYGNEEDFFLKLSADKYTASWNRLIPQLKRATINGHFIGPVNYQYNPAYLQYFLQHAQPLPDEVSWHEYTCGSNWANDICISHIDNWTTHIAKSRDAMRAAIGKTLPIMISEWNYTANPTPNDGKSNDSAFMTTWTTKALQTLAANNIFAAMQYSCTNYAIPLVDSHNAMTTQGTVFQNQYQNIVGN
ncbi:hypothetical protein KSF_018640 [Reticulibacter mediterranei]|uniref:Asl1-like glycosyl hydrolase catalytic domain-containing protein n=1 Tax=Reticulibacter mediterranei TaxID=2778369 RepID=A0A8J3IKF6_9CHLR|nr:hypothetical protein [Reticulibacter mediterranei]GHO91816.1 hypothetical protein KSF_018640 [Reticulibacter mediterranei]